MGTAAIKESEDGDTTTTNYVWSYIFRQRKKADTDSATSN